MKTIIVLTCSKWDEVPRIRHQVTRQLARHYKVIFVEIPFGWLHHGYQKSEVVQVEPNIYRFQMTNLFVLPGRLLYSSVFLNRIAQRLWLNEILDKTQHLFEGPLFLLSFIYNCEEFMKSDRFNYRVYLCNDNWEAMAPYQSMKAATFLHEQEASHLADLCLAVSYPLVEKIKTYNSNCLLFLPGHEFDIQKAFPIQESKPNHIKVGYMGYINDRLEIQWLKEAAQCEDIEIHLIGSIEDDLEQELNHPRIHVHTPRVGLELQKFLCSMDVLTVPYRRHPSLDVITAPNKLFQYLAAGKPVVISDMPAFVHLPNGVLYRAQDAASFIREIRKAKSENCDTHMRLRQEIARENSWAVRGEQLYGMLEHAPLRLTAKGQRFVGITIDYETWHPDSPQYKIDWDKTIFQPTEGLFDIFSKENVAATFFIEMGEYMWLKENDPVPFGKMREQILKMARLGHDVQLHLHPCWLPELGAKYIHEKDIWYWDWSLAKAHDYPGDLTKLIGNLKKELEDLICPEFPLYKVTSFRAGAYQAQPFQRLSQALRDNQILCDSSVYYGGLSAERGYDYRQAYAQNQPYFASPYDPQLLAPPAETAILELPVFCYAQNKRCFTDDKEGNKFGKRLLRYYKRLQRLTYLRDRVPGLFQFILNIFPHLIADTRFFNNHYFVLIGHTKARQYFKGIQTQIQLLKKKNFVFATMTQMASAARLELATRPLVPLVKKVSESSEFMADLDHLHSKMPWTAQKVLNLSRTQLTNQKSEQQLPWINVSAQQWIGSSDEPGGLGFVDETLDAVCAVQLFEYAHDVQAFFAECFRTLKQDGVLLAAIPWESHNGAKWDKNQSWQTNPEDVKRRLQKVGFADVEITGKPRHKMYVRAWKRPDGQTQRQRVRSVMDWVYRTLDTSQIHTTQNPKKIVVGGYAWCYGISRVMCEALRQEGYLARVVSFTMRNHPKGRGPSKHDSHTLVEVCLDGTWQAFDPTANIDFAGASLQELTQNPQLADRVVTTMKKDKRYLLNNYYWYCTGFAYERVTRVYHESFFRESYKS